MKGLLIGLQLSLFLVVCGCGKGRSAEDDAKQTEIANKTADDAARRERDERLEKAVIPINDMATRHGAISWEEMPQDEAPKGHYTIEYQQALEGKQKKSLLFVGIVSDIVREQGVYLIKLFSVTGPDYDSIPVHVVCSEEQATDVLRIIRNGQIREVASLAVIVRNLEFSSGDAKTFSVHTTVNLDTGGESGSYSEASPGSKLLVKGELVDFLLTDEDVAVDWPSIGRAKD